ncbi:GPI ethanolamine phosphate transferase 3-like [Gossypium australe]|uniref:GPI ethanolamine phosphate transferase 3-like n=1 Tax=Gossypium australe TaxID=47621 RepID=A0A5B6VE70_9ROSI|nr:GPI ethanolamine phosphate transferase 3-like [Gossypium australe]
MWGWWRFGKWTVLIMFLHIIAILIFTKGFLLTRTELPHSSHCSDLSQSPCHSSPSSSSSCWTKPAVDRLIIIVLDALRFDFVAPSSFFEEKQPWMDKLKVLQRMASENPSSAKIFKAIADPPTTSLQRLKGLTTGALPTFIDVGNSFGAPAIVEDNFINQLIQNGKRVVMMGDDTWTQLFPNHFNKSYPYPSFNVKDLNTVDNGCIEHLLPSLYQQDWDVLIAHFLGVDHAGHIHGVDSTPMIEKLEQYNAVLEKVIKELQNQSGPGKLHENSLLLVMGDHGQTLNGDHGGGSPEEVETSIFAMSFKDFPSLPSEFDSSSCEPSKNICISSIPQLDFAVTVSSLLGVPFPFGSIGRVNPELYALAVCTWNMDDDKTWNNQDQTKLEEWLQNYANVLCINSWQVKRYIDVYSASSVIGFSSEDLFRISDLYSKADENWSYTKNLSSYKNGNSNTSLPVLKRQIVAYSNFLSYVAELARSKWTEFNLKMMGTGIGIMLLSLYCHTLAIKKLNKSCGVSLLSSRDSGISFGLMLTFFMVLTRAGSLLSNMKEGKAANFLLATTGIMTLRYSFMKNKMLIEAAIFLLLTFIFRIAIEVGLYKQAATSQFMSSSSSWMLGISISQSLWTYMTEIVPILALIILGYFLNKSISSCCWGIPKYVILGTILSYFLIALHWISESNILDLAHFLKGFGKNCIPWTVYAITLVQLSLLAIVPMFSKEETSNFRGSLFVKMMSILSACSSTIIILQGKQGALVALGSLLAGYCMMRLQGIEQHTVSGTAGISILDPLPVLQWSLLAVCLLFASGHWCAFDGLRYGAAFVGFDEFILIPQAILLTIDTFGFSHILSVFGLPLFVAFPSPFNQTEHKSLFPIKLFWIFMVYGLITAITATATILCVTIQRRHLMVWGLFAPKFVFDVVGLILTDLLIFVASIYYFNGVDPGVEDRIGNAELRRLW